jgi:hypothetical protein
MIKEEKFAKNKCFFCKKKKKKKDYHWVGPPSASTTSCILWGIDLRRQSKVWVG